MNGRRVSGRQSVCWKCGDVVLWRNLNGVPVALSRCAPGRGNIAIQTEINGSEIAVPAGGLSAVAGWRRHSETCAVQSFTATAPGRKTR